MKTNIKGEETLFRGLRGPLSLKIRGVLSLSLLAFLVCLFTGNQLHAQVNTADVLGTVTDQTGALVPRAKITLLNLGTGVTFTAETNTAGDYVFNLLIPGRYSLAVEANGFKKAAYPEIVLVAGDRTREDATLLTGSAEETITVSVAPPLLQTDSSAVTSVVTEKAVEDLPLNGRNLFGLVQVLPGVNGGQPQAISNGNRVDNFQDSSTLSANGQSDAYNNYLLDGMDNNEEQQGFPVVRPSVDAVAEVKVDTNLFTAAISRDAGAVVNVITKTGTNQYHGSLYDFFRNDIFDARDFFAYAADPALGRDGVNKPEYRQNQFGGSLGGPIVKNKTFFFADAEERRIVVANPASLQTVPSLQEEQRGGVDFTDAGGTVVSPSQVSAPGLALFKMYPAPNNGGQGALFNNFVYNANKIQNVFSLDGRIDQHLNNGDQIYGRYSYNNWYTTVPGSFPNVTVADMNVSPGGGVYSTTIAHGFALSYIHPFSSSLLMELKTGYSRISINSMPVNLNEDISAAIGINGVNVNTAPLTGGLADTNMQGYANLGDTGGVPIVSVNNVFQYQGSLTYTHGGHNIEAGAQLVRRQLNYFQSIFPVGILYFFAQTGNSLEDMVEGQSVAWQRLNQIVKQGFRIWESGEYVQDNWRVNRSLTLNLGFRYDLYPPNTEAHGLASNFDYNSLQIILATQNPTLGLKTNYHNLAPRVGFSQTLWKNNVLKGGYGLSFYPILRGRQIDGINDPPYGYNVVYLAPPLSSNPEYWPNVGEPVALPTSPVSGNYNAILPNTNTSYVHMFNLMAQHQFGENVLTVGGVGELTRHAYYNATLNDPAPNGPYPNDATQGPPPPLPFTTFARNPALMGIGAPIAEATDNYYAMQVVLERRFAHGLAYNLNYTWARGLGDSTESTGGDGLTGGNQPIPRLDYGNTGVDIRNRLGANASYQVPFARESHGLAAALAKGWVGNVLMFWESGEAFGVANGVANPWGYGQTNQQAGTARTALVPGKSFYTASKSINGFLNPLAFTPQPAGTIPDGANNQQYGPHLRRADLSFLKNFDLSERKSLQFRAEVYNISNTPNFQTPNNTISQWTEGPQHDSLHPIQLSDYPQCSSNPQCVAVGLLPGDTATNAGGFGTIGATAYGINPRQFQFALKYLF